MHLLWRRCGLRLLSTVCACVSTHSLQSVSLTSAAQVDVFAFGLVVLELTTLKRLDHWSSARWPELLDSVRDPETKAFVAKCLGPEDQRPTVAELLEARCRRPRCCPADIAVKLSVMGLIVVVSFQECCDMEAP